MSKKLFSDKEVRSLAKNKYVTKVSSKAITYSFEFKKRFVEEYKKGKLARLIFEDSGFDVEVLGKKRIEASGTRWRREFNQG